MMTQKRSRKLMVTTTVALVLAGVATPLLALAPNATQEVPGRTTDLEQTVAPVPWGDTFQLGAGIDAVTGGVAGTAIKPFTPSAKTIKSARETVSAVTDLKTLKQEIETSISGKYNIYTGVNIKGKLEYLNKLDSSKNSTTVVAKYVSITDDYAEGGPYELTDQARATMQSDRKAFRQRYGDYFVAGVKRGSQFTAVYHMQTTKKDDLNKFKSNIGVKAEVPEVDVNGAANFNAKFEQSLGQGTIQYDIDVYMDGVDTAYQMQGTKWTPKEVLKALNWFKTNEVGKPLMAKLQHYSTIDPSYNYPRTINVEPEVFNELGGIYANLWEVRAMFNALPANSTSKWKNAKDTFDRDVTANREGLAINMRLRNDLATRGRELISSLGKISTRKIFFDEVMSSRQDEPATGARSGCRSEPWEYGYTPNKPYWTQVVRDANGAVEVQSEKREFDRNWELAKKQEGTLAISDPSKLILGWTVISNWGGDHNGEWWKETNDKILLGTRGAVHVRGEETRGAHWTVIYYYVNNDDYPFHVKNQ
jgi:hypothetical protein